MRCQRRGLGTVSDDARLDHRAARSRGEAAQRAETRGATASEPAATLSARARTMKPAGLLSRREDAGDKTLPPYRLLRSDAARANVDFIVTGHGRPRMRWKFEC